MRLSSRSRCVPIVFVVVFMTVSLTWPPGLGIPLAFQTLCAEDFTGSNLPDTGVSSGLIVHLGCGDGRLTADLHASNQCLVHGLDADPANVKKARQYLRARGLRGTVSVDALRGSRLPYADNLVNLVVAHDLGPVPMSEVNRALVPGGVAYVKHSDGWQRTVKTRSADLDEWTHWLHDPSGNAVARDQAVGPPRRFQWKAAPLWSRHHNTVPSVSAMVSANGRVFTIVDEAPPAMAGAAPDKWFLVARDAFNGIELWRKPITDWGWRAWSTFWNERFNQPNNVPKRLVAVGDRIYVTLGFNAELTALDAATGDVVQRYEGTDHADEILYQDGLLILSVNKQPQGPGKVKDKPPVKKYVTVLDAKTGNELWRTGDFVGTSTKTGPLERVTHLLLAAIGNQVFVLDEEEVVSLDLDTGEELWCSPRPRNSDYTSRYHHRMSEMCTLVATEEVVLLCQLEPIQKRIGWRVIKARLQAYDTKTGDPLWQYRCGNWGHFCVPDVFVTQGLVWVHDKETMSIVGLEPETGVEQRRVSTKKALDYGHHHRCYRNKATDRYLLTSYRGVEFIDWTSGDVNRNHWVRGTCRYGVMPCNGLLYSTPHPCDCYITSKLNGFYALAPNAKQEGPDPETKKIPASDSSDRLETGPAYDNVSSSQSETGGSKSEDWPMYRHDAARTGCASGPAPSNLTVKWKAPSPGGPVSAPVVSGDHVLIASVAFPTIHALDAESGAEKWSYLAGGGLDTPPTVWDGRVIFGGRDGWVYCLRLSDGALIWRFHAAPTNRLVVAHGSLESAWPLNGSVLVRDGKVYAVAGRSSFLDGGLMAYCLDASTARYSINAGSLTSRICQSIPAATRMTTPAFFWICSSAKVGASTCVTCECSVRIGPKWAGDSEWAQPPGCWTTPGSTALSGSSMGVIKANCWCTMNKASIAFGFTNPADTGGTLNRVQTPIGWWQPTGSRHHRSSAKRNNDSSRNGRGRRRRAGHAPCQFVSPRWPSAETRCSARERLTSSFATIPGPPMRADAAAFCSRWQPAMGRTEAH
ncbi:MAG: PQQ-binding-like beta-propeller repeat protein [Pirellulaceae bacterium]